MSRLLGRVFAGLALAWLAALVAWPAEHGRCTRCSMGVSETAVTTSDGMCVLAAMPCTCLREVSVRELLGF